MHKWLDPPEVRRPIEITDDDGSRLTMTLHRDGAVILEVVDYGDSVSVAVVDGDRRALIVALGGTVS